MRVEDATRLSANDVQAGSVEGPIVAPGAYQVRLTWGDTSLTQSFNIVRDTMSETAQEDLQAQYDLLLQIRDKMSEMNSTINNMRLIRSQLKLWTERLGEADLGNKAKDISEKVLEIEKVLMRPDGKPGWLDLMNPGVQLNQQLSSLTYAICYGDYKPTDQAYAVFEKHSGEIDAVIAQYQALIDGELAAFNQELTDSGMSVVGV
ncbi:MAG: hypothetical protein Q9P01_16405 [Anaerolineae bacterium]|nr:hypothetical protein [Anaerolineae bacterium]